MSNYYDKKLNFTSKYKTFKGMESGLTMQLTHQERMNNRYILNKGN